MLRLSCVKEAPFPGIGGFPLLVVSESPPSLGPIGLPQGTHGSENYAGFLYLVLPLFSCWRQAVNNIFSAAFILKEWLIVQEENSPQKNMLRLP